MSCKKSTIMLFTFSVWINTCSVNLLQTTRLKSCNMPSFRKSLPENLHKLISFKTSFCILGCWGRAHSSAKIHHRFLFLCFSFCYITATDSYSTNTGALLSLSITVTNMWCDVHCKQHTDTVTFTVLNNAVWSLQNITSHFSVDTHGISRGIFIFKVMQSSNGICLRLKCQLTNFSLIGQKS